MNAPGTGKRLLTIVLAAGLAGTVAAQEFPVGWREVAVRRADNSLFDAWIYYPALADGPDTALDPQEAPYPGITFGHGFLSPPLLYGPTMRALAANGYIVVAPQSRLELLPDWYAYAEDMSCCLDFLEQENTRAGSFLQAAVNCAAFGMSGHSMGGGSCILAAAADTRVRAIVPLAPAKFGPPSVDTIRTLRVPVCILAGSEDTLTPLWNNAGPLFGAAPPPALLVVILGGSHCQFADLPIPEAICGSASIPWDRQIEITRHYMAGFFDLYLKGDPGARDRIWGLKAALEPDLVVWSRPGLRLRPRLRVLSARRIGVTRTRLSVENEGQASRRFRIQGWVGSGEIEVVPGMTGLLEPGGSARVDVTVQGVAVPAVADVAVITAHPEDDPLTSDSAVLLLVPAR
jgi:predicted dienelactone hydrolase